MTRLWLAPIAPRRQRAIRRLDGAHRKGHLSPCIGHRRPCRSCRPTPTVIWP